MGSSVVMKGHEHVQMNCLFGIRGVMHWEDKVGVKHGEDTCLSHVTIVPLQPSPYGH